MFVSASNCLTYKRFERAKSFQFTCRRSSPWAYSRCEANSTLNPTNGLRCRPCMNPSTMPRARSSRLSSREKNAGLARVRGSKDMASGFRVQDWELFRLGKVLQKRVFALGAGERIVHLIPGPHLAVLVAHGQCAAVHSGQSIMPFGVFGGLGSGFKQQEHIGVGGAGEGKNGAVHGMPLVPHVTHQRLCEQAERMRRIIERGHRSFEVASDPAHL